jgi:SAM-dependent methyltransferase
MATSRITRAFSRLMPADPWLERWLPLVVERAGAAPVLELGCGHGDDSAVLAQAGVDLVALDISRDDVEAARMRAPKSRFLVQDVREPFPLAAGSAGVVVASLSLHYFPFAQTQQLVERIRATLLSGGLLLCRLNSSNDHNYGASGHAEIERHYYSVKGQGKYFFDRGDIDRLFATGWRRLGCEERVTHKYGKPKSLWEVVLQKEGD